MNHEVAYSFNDLTLDKQYLSTMLGFPDGILPEPFDEYVQEAFREAENLCNIRGAYYLSNQCEFSSDNSKISIDGLEFEIGRTLAKEFKYAEQFAVFICTAGKEISLRAQMLLANENPVLGYVYDILGSMIVETATDLLQNEVKQIAKSNGQNITNRYSPGYCNWSVSDQHKLFALFPSNCCGIKLTDSALMHPIKSVSGIIGIGKNVTFREYTCDLCSMAGCFHKSHHRKR